MNKDIKTEFDNMLKAQVQIEVFNRWDKRVAKIENRLRETIIRLRRQGSSITWTEMAQLIGNTAKWQKFKKVEIEFIGTHQMVPEDRTYINFKCQLDDYECFIYIRSF